jgi:hypothetical protein
MDLHTRLRETQEDNKRLREALIALYEIKWTAEGLGAESQAKLFEDARDALKLPKGYATERGVGG